MIKFYHVTYHVNLPNHPIIQRGEDGKGGGGPQGGGDILKFIF